MLKRERISKLVGVSAAPEKMPLESHPYFREYFRLWNQRRYYDAHDVLEQIWLDKKYATSAHFLKGLIQAAGALVHLQKNFDHPDHPKHANRLQPASRLFALAEKNLTHPEDSPLSFDIRAFQSMLKRYSDALRASDYKVNPWTPATAPMLPDPGSR